MKLHELYHLMLQGFCRSHSLTQSNAAHCGRHGVVCVCAQTGADEKSKLLIKNISETSVFIYGDISFCFHERSGQVLGPQKKKKRKKFEWIFFGVFFLRFGLA